MTSFDGTNEQQSSFNSGFSGGGSDGGANDIFATSLLGSSFSIDPGNPTEYLQDKDLSKALFRISFRLTDPYNIYSSARFFVQGKSNVGINIFGGLFETSNGGSSLLVNKQLLGQSITDLARSVRNFDGVTFEILNKADRIDTRKIQETPVLDATEKWAYFFLEDNLSFESEILGKDKLVITSLSQENLTSQVRSDSNLNIRTFLTTAEPNIEQNNPKQSLGGFISPTQVQPATMLEESVSFFDTRVITKDNILNNFDAIQINDEIMKVESWQDNVAIIEKRNAFSTPIRFHPRNSIVRGINKNQFFDSIFNNNNKQYRCIAIRNDNSQGIILRDVKVYLKLLSRNIKSRTQFAIEIPRSDKYAGSVTISNSTSFLTDASIAGEFGQNHFVTAPLTFTSGLNAGQTRIVSSYDESTGTFIFDDPLPNVINAGDTFIIDTAPAQRVGSGLISPSTIANTDSENIAAPFNISGFVNNTFAINAVPIDTNDVRRNGNDLFPGEAMYIWLEREIDKNNVFFKNNRFVISLIYKEE